VPCISTEVSSSISHDVSKGHYCLVRDFKVIYKVVIGYNGTLSDKGRTVVIVGGLLEEAMPMLKGKHVKTRKRVPEKTCLTMEVAKSKELLWSRSTTASLSSSPYDMP
jgi:hypothetical protein